MLDKYNSNRSQAFVKPANVLMAIEVKAISIRKLLRQTKRTFGQRAWREMDDAIKLAVNIEALASKAVNLSAADATNSVGLLELMLEELSKKLDRIFAS